MVSSCFLGNLQIMLLCDKQISILSSSGCHVCYFEVISLLKEVSSFTFSGCVVTMVTSVDQWSWYFPPADTWHSWAWGVRTQTKGQWQAKWQDLQPLPSWGCYGFSLGFSLVRTSQRKQGQAERRGQWEFRCGCGSTPLRTHNWLPVHLGTCPDPYGCHLVGPRLWMLCFLWLPGLCLLPGADFLPTKENTDTVNKHLLYFFFPSLIPQNLLLN